MNGGFGPWLPRDFSGQKNEQYDKFFSVVLALCVASFLWPSYGEWKMQGIPNLAPPRLIKILLFLLLGNQFFSCGFNTSRISLRIGKNWLLILLLLAFHLFRMASLTQDYFAAIQIFNYIKQDIFSNFILLFFIVYVAKDERDVRRLMHALVFSMLVVAILSIVESFLKVNVFEKIVSDANLSTSFALSDKSRDGLYRANGTFEHPLLLANFAAVMLPVTWWVAKEQVGWRRLIALISIIGAASSAILSSTRSGVGIFGLTAYIVLLLEIWSWRAVSRDPLVKALAVVVLGGLTSLLAVTFIIWINQAIQGGTTEEAMSTFVRTQSTFLSIPEIITGPFLGQGPTGVGLGVGLFGRYGKAIDSYLILLGLESGLVSLFLFVMVFACLIVGFSRRAGLKSVDARLHLALAVSSSVLFVYISVVHALNGMMPMLYILIGCLCVLNSCNVKRNFHKKTI